MKQILTSICRLFMRLLFVSEESSTDKKPIDNQNI